MEKEIQEELEKIYNFPISVKFIDFRYYNIMCYLGRNKISVDIMYNGNYSFKYNLNNIVEKIDKNIILLYRKENKNE